MWVVLSAYFSKIEYDIQGNPHTIYKVGNLNHNIQVNDVNAIWPLVEYVQKSADEGMNFHVDSNSGFNMDPAGLTSASISSNCYEIRTGRAHVVLPAPFNSSACGLVNIRNTDDNCFKYCISAATNQPKNNASRVDYYISKKNQENGGLDRTGVSFPASLKDVRRFESNNPSVAISCFSLDDENRNVHPLYLSKANFDDNAPTKNTINLHFYKEHWVLISSLDRLLNPETRTSATIAPDAFMGSRVRTSERTT
jgi:hypothetical protein